MGEAVAGGAVGVVLDIEHAGEGDAIARPATAVLKKEVGLDGAGRDIRAGKVVTTADEASVGGTDVMVAKGRVDEASTLGSLCGCSLLANALSLLGMVRERLAYLDHDKASTAVVGGRKVNVGLVSRDVETLDSGRGDRGKTSNAGEKSAKGLHDCIVVRQFGMCSSFQKRPIYSESKGLIYTCC